MGTDARAHIEIKVDGKWELYSSPYIPRNYELFSRMAGVRRVEGIEPISAPRGRPTDLSPITALLLDDYDGMDESWLSGEELDQIINEFTTYGGKHFVGYANDAYVGQLGFGYLLGNGFNPKNNRQRFIQDCRVVFAFDS
jgi:hypothetical protein